MRPGGMLFLSPSNSVRSQIAEAFARSMVGSCLEIYSAGSEPTALHPCAIRVMNEVGIDLRGQRAKPIEGVPLGRIALAVALDCEECWPALPAQIERVYCGLEDPSRAGQMNAQMLSGFRGVRDQIGCILREYFRRRRRAGGLGPERR